MNKHSYYFALIALFILMIPFAGKSQDPYYSQYYNTPLLYNPASVGMIDGMKVRLNYRNQWPQYSDDLKSYNFSMDVAERHMPGAGGLGVIFNTNKEGDGLIQKTTFGGLGSVRVRMNRNMLTQFGFMAAYVQKSINRDDFIWSDQLDNRHGLLYPQSSFPGFSEQYVYYPDVSLVGIWNYENQYRSLSLGFAVHHVLKPNESFYDLDTRVPRKYVAHADMVIFQVSNMQKGFRFNPGIMVENMAGFNTFNLGMNVAKSVLYGGAWYRNKQSMIYDYQSVILLAGINIPMVNDYSRMKLMYSYDISISGLKGAGGTHEISLRFEFDQIHFVKSQSAFANDYPIIYDPVVF